MLSKHGPSLQIDPDLSKFIQDYPSRTVVQKVDLLVRSYHAETPPRMLFGTRGPKWGCHKYGDCVACRNIRNAKEFQNSSRSRSFEIQHFINCNTEGVVYGASCPCGLVCWPYITQTEDQDPRTRTRYSKIKNSITRYPVTVSTKTL